MTERSRKSSHFKMAEWHPGSTFCNPALALRVAVGGRHGVESAASELGCAGKIRENGRCVSGGALLSETANSQGYDLKTTDAYETH